MYMVKAQIHQSGKKEQFKENIVLENKRKMMSKSKTLRLLKMLFILLVGNKMGEKWWGSWKIVGSQHWIRLQGTHATTVIPMYKQRPWSTHMAPQTQAVHGDQKSPGLTWLAVVLPIETSGAWGRGWTIYKTNQRKQEQINNQSNTLTRNSNATPPLLIYLICMTFS